MKEELGLVKLHPMAAKWIQRIGHFLARIEHAPTCYSLPRVDNLVALNPKSLQIEIMHIVIRHF